MRAAVSLVMIVRDEQRCLARCLDSVAGVVDELVVVDTGSTDDTVTIARAAGARVLHEPWHDDFAAARNVGLAAATGEWILHLDADEELDADSRPRLRDALRRAGAAAAVRLTIRNLLPDDELQAFVDAPNVRLFRNRPAHRYEGRVHEQILEPVLRAGGRVVDAPGLRIVHHGYRTDRVQGGQSRTARNLRLLGLAALDHPDDPAVLAPLGKQLAELGHFAEALETLLAAVALDDRARRLPGVARAEVHVFIGQLLLNEERYNEAANHARGSLERHPGNLLALRVLGLALFRSGRLAAAAPVLEQARRHPELHPRFGPELDALVLRCRSARAATAGASDRPIPGVRR
ncbi:MAG: glycosyltransferase [Acidimicrobiales bacterium]